MYLAQSREYRQNEKPLFHRAYSLEGEDSKQASKYVICKCLVVNKCHEMNENRVMGH